MAKIHETKIKITTKHAQAVTGLKAVRSAAGKLVPSFNQVRSAMLLSAAAAAGLTVAIFALVKSSAKAGDEFDKMSKRLGISAQTLSELKFAAELSGASIEDIEKSIKKLSRSAVDADRGLLTYQRAFDDLGVEVRDTNGVLKDSETLFNEVSEALVGIESNTKKTALAQELFGKSGTKLIPLFKEGADGIKALREEAEFLGITYSDEAAAGAAAFIDANQRLTDSFKGVKIGLAADLQKPMSDFFNASSTWIAEHRTEIILMAKDWITAFAGIAESVVVTGGEVLDFFDRIGAGIRELRIKVIQRELRSLEDEMRIDEDIDFMGEGFLSTGAALTEQYQKLRLELVKLTDQQQAWAGDTTKTEKILATIDEIRAKMVAATAAPITPAFTPAEGEEQGPRAQAAQREIDQLNAMWDAQFLTENERLDIKLGEQLAMFEGDTAAKIQVLQIFEAKKLQLAKKDLAAQAKKQAIEKQLRQKGFNDFVGNLQAIGNVSRTAFEAWKLGATAQAIITGITGVQEAWRSGMQTPGPHAPIVAAAYAAAAAGASAARVSAIQSSSYSGGGGNIPSGGGGGVSVGGFEQAAQPLIPETILTPSVTETDLATTPGTIIINIKNEGNLIDMSDIMDQIGENYNEWVRDRIIDLNVT